MGALNSILAAETQARQDFVKLLEQAMRDLDRISVSLDSADYKRHSQFVTSVKVLVIELKAR